MNQHTFDFSGNARQSDPWTSQVAADNVVAFGARHIDIILAALKKYGAMTIDEIAKRTPLNSVQIARRLADMEKRNLAEPTGRVRMSASGRPERVWRSVA